MAKERVDAALEKANAAARTHNWARDTPLPTPPPPAIARAGGVDAQSSFKVRARPRLFLEFGYWFDFRFGFVVRFAMKSCMLKTNSRVYTFSLHGTLFRRFTSLFRPPFCSPVLLFLKSRGEVGKGGTLTWKCRELYVRSPELWLKWMPVSCKLHKGLMGHLFKKQGTFGCVKMFTFDSKHTQCAFFLDQIALRCSALPISRLHVVYETVVQQLAVYHVM